MFVNSIRLVIAYFMCFHDLVSGNWSENLFMKALKYSLPSNYSPTVKKLSLKKNEIEFFPFPIYLPYFNDIESKVQIIGYVAMRWQDPQIREWNYSLPDWEGLKRFPLVNFENYPYQLPSLIGIDPSTVTLYVQSDGYVTYWAKIKQTVDCYRLREYEYPMEKYQCDHDWMLVERESFNLVCNSDVFEYNFDCKSFFNGSSYWDDYIEDKLKVWTIDIQPQSLSNPQRISFSVSFSRKNINEAIIDYGISSYISVILVAQMVILPNREERLLIALFTLLNLICELDSLEGLVVIRDNPAMKIMSYHKSLIVIQLSILIESLLAYYLLSLKNHVPVPEFIAMVFRCFFDRICLFNTPFSNLAVLNKVLKGVHSKRRNLDDYILHNSTDDDLIVNTEVSSSAGFSQPINKKIHMKFYDEEETGGLQEINECENNLSTPVKRLNWFYVTIFLDRLVLIVVICAVSSCALIYRKS